MHKAQELIYKYLKDEIKAPVVKVLEFTDGCATQYKSRHCVGDLSCCLADFGYQINRNYFETSYARGEQDAAGSNVKQKVSQAILRKTAVIRNGKDIQDFLSSSLMSPAATTFSSRTKSVGLQRRKFFCVPPTGNEAVVRNRPGHRFDELKGIRKIHCVKTTAEQGKVLVRDRTCYRLDCIHGDETNCSNKEWLDAWKEVKLPRETSAATTRQSSAETDAALGDTAVRIADLATEDSVVAIAAADDAAYEYNLLKVTSDGIIEMEEDFTDDYGSSFEKNTAILIGHFFVRENLIDMTFRLEKRKLALVLPATVRHICEDLKEKKKGIFQVPIEVNDDIIASL